MRPTIIAGNWKHHPSRDSANTLYQEICNGVTQCELSDSIQVHVFPPLPYLSALPRHNSVRIGAQDVSPKSWGAFTGEVGAELLSEFGVTHVIVGHSERRHIFGESDAVVAEKVSAAQSAGLTPIVCVGETESERDKNETFNVLATQLEAVEGNVALGLMIAYEPVWAIGTGRTATPEQAVEAHRFIRERVAERVSAEAAEQLVILYGGSVKPENAAELLSEGQIDGALIGGASLKSDSFLGIVTAAQENA